MCASINIELIFNISRDRLRIEIRSKMATAFNSLRQFNASENCGILLFYVKFEPDDNYFNYFII